MATALSKYTETLRSKPAVEYAWWKHHVLFFTSLFIALPILLTVTYGLAGLYSFLGIKPIVLALANVGMWVILGTIVVTVFGALPGYYYDAKFLDAHDADYAPRWRLYTAVHVVPFVGPFVAIPLYVIQRFRHVGIPISQFF